MSTVRMLWRKSLNYVMLTLTGVAAFAVVSVLFLILGYLIWNGGTSLNLNFFTQLPKPVGETGGGMANAIVGSLKLLFLAAIMGLPVGLLAGVYLAEFGGKTLLVHRPLHRRLAQWRPFHRHRHLCVLARRAALKAFLRARRRRGPWHHGDPHHRSQHGGISCAPSPATCAKAPWPWAPANGKRSQRSCCPPLAGHSHRNVASFSARRRRNRPAALHRLRQSLLEPGLGPTHRLASGYDIYLRRSALR